ncbi:hypothetical protein M885DRAFT_611932, partial [Pelagophyceae sp. CCMP2097]
MHGNVARSCDDFQRAGDGARATLPGARATALAARLRRADDERRAARKRPRRRRFKFRGAAALLVVGGDDSNASSSGESVSDDTDDSDAGEAADSGLLGTERRFELCQFLVRRIAVAPEDDAHGTPAGSRAMRREQHRARLGEALLDFERWARAAAPPLAAPGADAVCAKVRGALAFARGGGARSALTLIAVADDGAALEDVKHVAPWAPNAVGPLDVAPLTARISLDARNDFVVSVARVSDQDLAARRTHVEGARMATEDERSQRATAFRAHAEAESRTALRAYASRQAAEILAQDRARLARRSAAAAAAQRAQHEAERLDGAAAFQEALLEAARRAIHVLAICVDAGVAHLRLNDSGDGGDFSTFWETPTASQPVLARGAMAFGVDGGRWPLWGGARAVVCQHAATLKAFVDGAISNAHIAQRQAFEACQPPDVFMEDRQVVSDEAAIKDDDSGANCNAGGDSTASDGASDAAFDAGSNAASDEG